MSYDSAEKKQNLEVRTLRGMRDLFGDDAAVYSHIVEQLQKVVRTHGYTPIETPILELTSIFTRSLGEETDVVSKEMFSFIDRSEISVSLRPEGTASIARALITNKLTQTLPQKWFYCGPMFRYDRPQKGRYRQFYQFGVEHLGTHHPLSDVESIAAAYDALRVLKIPNFVLKLNSVGDFVTRQKYKEKLVQYFSQYASDLSLDSQRRLANNPLRILDSKETCDQKISKNAPSILDSLTKNAACFFDQVRTGLDQLKISYELDPMLVRGLDYYDHTTFEFKTALGGDQGGNMAIVGGGRYNGLIEQMGGPNVPSVGWAFGIDRVMLALDRSFVGAPKSVTVLFITEQEQILALQLAQQLRTLNLFPVLFPTDGSFIKRLKYSDKVGATCALILGAEEARNETVKCKFLYACETLKAGHEVQVPLDRVANFLKEHLQA